MLSNHFLLIKVDARTKENKRVFIPIPIALFAAEEFLSDLLDLFYLLNKLIPDSIENKTIQNNHSPVPLSFKSITGILMILEHVLFTLRHMEPFDLVQVKTEEANITIKLR